MARDEFDNPLHAVRVGITRGARRHLRASSMAKNPTKPVPASRSVPRQSRIPSVNLKELVAIWDVDKRMPSAPSRRAWAHARRLRPEQVNNWFYRKKGAAKKNGIILPDATYELPIGTPPALPNTPSLPPSSSPLPETPMTKSSDYICVKKEDPCYQEEMAAAMLSDDSVFHSLTPAHFSSSSSDAPGSVVGCDDIRCDNLSVGSRFSARSAGTRTPLTPVEPSFFFSADTPYIMQPKSYYNAESKSSENRAYISYTPSIPWSHSAQPVFDSGMQKGDLEHASCFSSYYSGKDSQLQTHAGQTLPISSVTLPQSVFVPSVPAASTFCPISQPLQNAKAPSLTGPAQPGIVHYEERIQLLQSLNYTYDTEVQDHPAEGVNATDAPVRQGGPYRYPMCINLFEPSGLDATWNPPYSNLGVSTGSNKILSPHPLRYTVPDITAPSSASFQPKFFCSRQSSYYSVRPASTTAATAVITTSTNKPGAYRVSNTGTAPSISTG